MARFNQYWSAVLLIEIFILIFLTGFFPESQHPFVGPFLFSLLYLTAALGLEKNRTTMLQVAGVLLIAQLVFKIFDLDLVEAISKFLNISFFVVIVGKLIYQIATAREVTSRVILEAINGYLLLGLVFALLVGLMIQFDAGAFNFTSKIQSTLLDPLYFTFVTFATLGYGDLLPVKPYAKSLAILIAVCGQLYIAAIIALLVGKFSSRRT